MIPSELIKGITPDWEFSGSIERIQKEFDGFLVSGPGWYAKQNTWVLAIATGSTDTYTLWVFFDRDPRIAFSEIAHAPVKMLIKEHK